jgi:Domain of unknown function (DUF4410)
MHKVFLIDVRFVLATLMTFSAILLSGCAGTVKSDMKEGATSATKLLGVFEITTQVAPSASQKIVDNPQFNRNELADWVKRRLDAKGLMAPGAKNKVEITVTDVRIRSAVTAILLGVLAGGDVITAQVRLIDENQRQVRSFEVSASYAFGGYAGGQDSLRMNWLYEKFSDLTLAELEKTVSLPDQSMRAAPLATPLIIPVAPANAPTQSTVTPTPSQATTAVIPNAQTEPTAAPGSVSNPKGPLVTGAVYDINNPDMIPLVYNGCRKHYREEYLTRGAPKAFVISENGHCFSSWGKVPLDPTMPVDVSERALQHCYNAGRKNCTLYAVGSNVVYQMKAQ